MTLFDEQEGNWIIFLLLALLLHLSRDPAKCAYRVPGLTQPVPGFGSWSLSAATSGSRWLPGLPRAPGCLQSQPPWGRSCPTRGLDRDVRTWSQGLLRKEGFCHCWAWEPRTGGGTSLRPVHGLPGVLAGSPSHPFATPQWAPNSVRSPWPTPQVPKMVRVSWAVNF